MRVGSLYFVWTFLLIVIAPSGACIMPAGGGGAGGPGLKHGGGGGGGGATGITGGGGGGAGGLGGPLHELVDDEHDDTPLEPTREIYNGM